MNQEQNIPNADLIRAVLDGKEVQHRDAMGGAWVPMGGSASHMIKTLLDYPGRQVRVKPEPLIKWCGIARCSDPDNTSGVVVRGHIVRPPSSLLYNKILRLELDPDTLEVIYARTEEP